MGLFDSTPAINGTISYEEARDMLVRIVHDKGRDYKDPVVDQGRGGYYFYQGKPACVIGELLDRRGVTVDQLGALNQSAVSRLSNHGILVPADGRTFTLLRTMQSYNDRGWSWYYALKVTLRLYDADFDLDAELEKLDHAPGDGGDFPEMDDFLARFSGLRVVPDLLQDSSCEGERTTDLVGPQLHPVA